MLVQKPEKLWETRPLDCWAKAKELRAKFYETEKEAREQRVFVIGGGDGPQQMLGPGFGNCHFSFPVSKAPPDSNRASTIW